MAAGANENTNGLLRQDLLVGSRHQSQVATLVDRTTSVLILVPLTGHHSDKLGHGPREAFKELPPALRQSITWGQGTEIAQHARIAEDLGMPIYFCDPGSPWQRDSNENTNGLLRQFLPKNSDLNHVSSTRLQAITDQLNNRPRATLGDRSPAELFTALLTSHNHPVLR